jgi:hypothetical protein
MTPASHITMDESLWPLIVVRMSGTPSDRQFEDYLAVRQSQLDRQEKHVIIYDAVRLHVLTNEQRQRQIDWFKARTPLMRQYKLGSALVITSPLVRLTLSVIQHFVQGGMPYYAARSVQDAAAWSSARLAEAGLLEAAQRVREHFGLNSQRSMG